MDASDALASYYGWKMSERASWDCCHRLFSVYFVWVRNKVKTGHAGNSIIVFVAATSLMYVIVPDPTPTTVAGEIYHSYIFCTFSSPLFQLSKTMMDS